MTRVHAVRGAIRRDATTNWGVSPRAADALFLLPLVGVVVVVASLVERPLFHFLTDEDSLLEWLQFAGYAAAAALGLAIIARLRRMGARPELALFALFAAGCLMVAGEEISWGQRLLGWGTPESLAQINHQGETTVHNIGGAHETFNTVMLVVGLYGFIVPRLVHLRGRGRLPERVRLIVPPLFLSSAFLVLLAYKASRLVLFAHPQSATVSAGEWPEFCLAFALMVSALLMHLRLRRSEHAGRAGAAGDVAPRRPEPRRAAATARRARPPRSEPQPARSQRPARPAQPAQRERHARHATDPKERDAVAALLRAGRLFESGSF